MRGLLSQVELLVFLTMKTFNRKGLKTPGTNPDLKFRKTVPPDLMRVATWILLWIPLCQQSVMSAVRLQEGWNIFLFQQLLGTASCPRVFGPSSSGCCTLGEFIRILSLLNFALNVQSCPTYITCSLTVTSLTTATHLGSRIYSSLLTCFLCQ